MKCFRDEGFAQKMTARGVAVAGYDLRGHGKYPGNSAVAFFGKEGWEATLQDMHRFLNNLAARFPGIPHHLLGFSPGSFCSANIWVSGQTS